jgi:hypothetical protein
MASLARSTITGSYKTSGTPSIFASASRTGQCAGTTRVRVRIGVFVGATTLPVATQLGRVAAVGNGLGRLHAELVSSG